MSSVPGGPPLTSSAAMDGFMRTLGGGIGGVGLGILISAASSKKPKHATSSKKLKQVKIDDYYRKQTKYFSEDEIPKSIKDYYKNKD